MTHRPLEFYFLLLSSCSPHTAHMKEFHIFVGTHNCGMVGLCNNVFPIVLSLSGPCCHALRVIKKTKKTSTPAQLSSQHNRWCYFSEKHSKSANHYTASSAPAPHRRSGAVGGVPGREGSGLSLGFLSRGQQSGFLREIAGLSVLQFAVSRASNTLHQHRRP